MEKRETESGGMVIGIAGGVGSGKSTVLEILEQHYHAVICIADEIGHRAMQSGTEVCARIVERFGRKIELPDGGIDRNALSEIVYRDDELLKELNGIVHPFVHQEIRRQIARCPADRMFVLETAILFESGCDELCDEVWGVVTEDDIRIRRLMKSRNYSREKAVSIMKHQMSRSELTARCDYVIVNDGSREELLRQVHKKCTR